MKKIDTMSLVDDSLFLHQKNKQLEEKMKRDSLIAMREKTANTDPLIPYTPEEIEARKIAEAYRKELADKVAVKNNYINRMKKAINKSLKAGLLVKKLLRKYPNDENMIEKLYVHFKVGAEIVRYVKSEHNKIDKKTKANKSFLKNL